jgi:hypothetical protein
MWIIWTFVISIGIFLLIFIIKSIGENKQYNEDSIQIEKNLKSNGFNIDKALHDGKNHFIVDNYNNKVYISANGQQGQIYNYTDIIDYELIEDGQLLTKGTGGKAAIGALTFGVAGAIVGSSMKKQKNMCTNLQLIITVNDIINSNITMQLINNKWSKDGIEKSGIFYKSALEFAKNITSTLAAIKNHIA